MLRRNKVMSIFEKDIISKSIDILFEEISEDIDFGIELSYMLGMSRNRKTKQGVRKINNPEELKNLLGQLSSIWENLLGANTDLVLRATMPNLDRLMLICVPGDPGSNTFIINDQITTYNNPVDALNNFIVKVI